ncbi:hypothetical protein Avbf_07686 [Armadillidium vulgare]|nr:hypothetical protein Avbf_07686 [Armadillidium vulgare]
MQLEEILSAAVAAVDVNEIELDSIPSPSVELPLKNTQLNNYNNNNNIDNVVKSDDDRKFMTDLTSAKYEINMGLQYSESYPKYNTDISNDKNNDSCDDNNHSDEDETKQERGLDMPILIPLNEDEPEKQNDFETDFKNDKRNKILNKSDLNENMQHPVEVSFFDLGDENLVITSEQALEMFESIEANANNSGLVPLTESREHPVRNIGFDRYQNCDNFDNYYRNIPNNGEVNYINHNALPVDLNLEVPPPPCSIEEVVGFASEVEVESTSEIPSNSTSNIETIHQFNSDTPEYTMLTAPMEYNSVSSVVSGALRTISDGTPFDTPSCSSVDSSLEAENQFVVRVSAPGIDLAIPNHELSNYFSNTNNGNYSDTNDMDFLNAFNLSDENEIFKELCNDNTKHENNFECEKSRDEIVHETNEKEVKLKSLKRKRDPSESGKREEPPQKVPKNHNSVMAALRESIFRSKARKIVNQLGKEDNENTTLNEKSNNDKPPKKHIKKKDENSKTKDFNSNMKNFGSRKYAVQNDPNKTHSHCQNLGQNSRNSQNIQTSERNSEKSCYNLNEINSPALDNQKHEYKSPHDNTNRKRTYENDSPSRESFYKGENNIRREKQRTSSCSSCKCKCSSSNNEPYMMIRPEDLPSILKKNCNGENTPIVMLQPDALKDTDGEQLKVQLVYLVRSLNEKRMSRESSSHSPTHHHSIHPVQNVITVAQVVTIQALLPVLQNAHNRPNLLPLRRTVSGQESKKVQILEHSSKDTKSLRLPQFRNQIR